MDPHYENENEYVYEYVYVKEKPAMKMNRKFQIFILIMYGSGLLLLSLSRIFRNSLTDFGLGFCEGLSVTAIVIGSIYFCWCLIHRTNPYNLN